MSDYELAYVMIRDLGLVKGGRALRHHKVVRFALAVTGTVVIGGIVSSTLLTLLMLPALYSRVHRRERRTTNEAAGSGVMAAEGGETAAP